MSQQVQELLDRISQLERERDAAWNAAIEAAARIANEYANEAWGNSAEQAAAENIEAQIDALKRP